MITIVDYGMGNLRSVQKAFELFCSKVKVSSSARDIAAASKVVLPGVGAFGKAMEELEKKGLIGALKDAIKSGKPFLGICLGIQLLFLESEEAGRVKGLGILKGKVRKFDNSPGLKIPHMGWNKIKFKMPAECEARQRRQNENCKILDGVPDESHMYFVHSYYVEPEDKDAVLCETEYGAIFASAIQKDNIYAFQFHPEKSQKTGLNIIRNFAGL